VTGRRWARRPGDLREVAAGELLATWEADRALLVDARHGLGEPRGRDELAAAALDELATAAALVAHVGAGRWVAVAEALAYGAVLGEVAAAMGKLEVSEVVAGLRSWAGAQHRYGLLTGAQLDEIEALIERGRR